MDLPNIVLTNDVNFFYNGVLNDFLSVNFLDALFW